MAVIDRDLGISGRIGNIIYRRRNGKTILSSPPGKIKINTERAKEIRKNFGVGASFAKKIVSVESLKNIWASSRIASSAQNAVTKINIPLIKNGELTLDNMITPKGEDIILLSASVKVDFIRISFYLNSQSKIKFPVELYMYIHFNSDNLVPVFVYTINEPDNVETYNIYLEIGHYGIEHLLIDEPDPIVYIALSGSDERGKPVWTSTSALRLGDIREL